MDGKKVILIIVIVSLLGLILTWLWGQSLINKYDLERASSTIEYVNNIRSDSLNINFFV